GDGLFPSPKEIKMSCSCPDWAGMCKHVAATMYGVGARLDASPELLFTLRAVDHLELIGHAVAEENLNRTLDAAQGGLAGSDLGAIFGIDLDSSEAKPKKRSGGKKPAAKVAAAERPGQPPKTRRGKRAAATAAAGMGDAAVPLARGKSVSRRRSSAPKPAA